MDLICTHTLLHSSLLPIFILPTATHHFNLYPHLTCFHATSSTLSWKYLYTFVLHIQLTKIIHLRPRFMAPPELVIALRLHPPPNVGTGYVCGSYNSGKTWDSSTTDRQTVLGSTAVCICFVSTKQMQTVKVICYWWTQLHKLNNSGLTLSYV